MIRVGAACAGIGGLELAAAAVWDTRLEWVAEVDPAASVVLDARFAVPNLGDLTEITDPPQVDLLTAGFPCQPVSSAGRRQGVNDERWLIRDVMGLARRSGARWVLLENVRGLLTANEGEALRQVFAAVADHGYDAWWTCVRASDVGAPHRRERWFLFAADAESVGLERSRLARDGRCGPTDSDLRTEWGQYNPAIRRWERTMGTAAPVPVDGKSLSPRFVEWLMGYPAGWVTDLDLTRTQALKALGNAVVPQQGAFAITELLRLAEVWP